MDLFLSLRLPLPLLPRLTSPSQSSSLPLVPSLQQTKQAERYGRLSFDLSMLKKLDQVFSLCCSKILNKVKGSLIFFFQLWLIPVGPPTPTPSTLEREIYALRATLSPNLPLTQVGRWGEGSQSNLLREVGLRGVPLKRTEGCLESKGAHCRLDNKIWRFGFLFVWLVFALRNKVFKYSLVGAELSGRTESDDRETLGVNALLPRSPTRF